MNFAHGLSLSISAEYFLLKTAVNQRLRIIKNVVWNRWCFWSQTTL